eukprot:scaffold24631_cov60-Phaeocystis_antarctica.AAC.2
MNTFPPYATAATLEPGLHRGLHPRAAVRTAGRSRLAHTHGGGHRGGRHAGAKGGLLEARHRHRHGHRHGHRLGLHDHRVDRRAERAEDDLAVGWRVRVAPGAAERVGGGEATDGDAHEQHQEEHGEQRERAVLADRAAVARAGGARLVGAAAVGVLRGAAARFEARAPVAEDLIGSGAAVAVATVGLVARLDEEGTEEQRGDRLEPAGAVRAADVATAVGGRVAVGADGGEKVAQVGAADGGGDHARDAAHHAHGQPDARPARHGGAQAEDVRGAHVAVEAARRRLALRRNALRATRGRGEPRVEGPPQRPCGVDARHANVHGAAAAQHEQRHGQ